MSWCEDFQAKSWSNIDELLPQIAQHCIKKNLFRKGDNFRHQFDVCEIDKAYIGPPTTFTLNGCYAYLDESHKPCGTIKMWGDDENGNECDPMWMFYEENGVLTIEVD